MITAIVSGEPPSALSAPTANRSESPGRNGVTTSPVSQKMTRNSTRYSQPPILAAHPARCRSRWVITSQKLRISSIEVVPLLSESSAESRKVVASGRLAQVLGRVTGVQLDSPRGADVVHGVRVARSWLEAGDTVELTLPRNLHCAECDGGGCDRCGRAGAVSLWGREEPPAVLEVTLPRRSAPELRGEPVIVLRIPDAGGWPA